jgi:galactokinase/mevalonate kinase-like predicted kinase
MHVVLLIKGRSKMAIQLLKDAAVLQVYGGLVYMNLRPDAMRGDIGDYEYLPEDKLPQLWLMYADTPSNSAKVHSPVYQRWRDGEREVVEGVEALAELADKGRCLLELDAAMSNRALHCVFH